MAVKKKFPYRAAVVACNGDVDQPKVRPAVQMDVSDVKPV